MSGRDRWHTQQASVFEDPQLREQYAAARALALALVTLAAAGLFIVGVIAAGIEVAGTVLVVTLTVAAAAWHLVQLVREERARRAGRAR